MNTTVSYFLFAYKTALLEALQRLDLTKIAYTVVNMIQYLLQIISIVSLKNYYLFIVFLVLGTACKNLMSAYIAGKRFPQYFCEGDISDGIKKDIISRVKGLLICNISGVTYTTLDSIILSSFIGLKSVAIYSNYVVIYSGVMTFVGLIRNAMQASIGNSIFTESKEKNYQDLLLWQFLFSIIAIWCVTCMFCLYQPFMKIWMGEEMLLNDLDVSLLCLWSFFNVIGHAYYLYLGGNGLWWEVRWTYILSTISNLILNIVLGKVFGVTGIILATVIGSVVYSFIWQCVIIFRSYFNNGKEREYLFRQMAYLCLCICCCIVSSFLCNIMVVGGIGNLFIRLLISTFTSILLCYILLCRTDVFKRARAFLVQVIKS